MADKRPGVMLYFSTRSALDLLNDADAGKLFKAILDYGEVGIVPEFTDMLGVAWSFIKPLIDKDAERYEGTVKKRKYAAYCRSCSSKNTEPLSIEEWEVTICNHVVSYETNNNSISTPNTISFSNPIPVAVPVPVTTPNPVPETTSMTEGSVRGDTNTASPWPHDPEARKRAQIQALRAGTKNKNLTPAE